MQPLINPRNLCARSYAKLEAKNTALQEQLSAVGGGAEDLHLEIKALKREMQDAQDIADEQKGWCIRQLCIHQLLFQP